MAENRSIDSALVMMLKSVLILLCVLFKANFALMVPVSTQYQALQSEISQTIENESRAASK